MRASTTGIVMSIACVAASAAFAVDDLATLHAEAQALFERGDYPGAASRIKTAVAVAVREFGPDSLDTANIQTSYAALLLMQGEHDEAETVLTAALRTHEKRGQAETPDACIVLNSLALLHHSRGHYALAEPLSLGLLQKSTPGIARRSAGWLANGKAVGHEAASQQIILARQSANPATTEAVAALARARAELAKLSQMAPAPDEAVAYRAKLAELQAEEHELVHEIGGQLAALDRDEPWVEIDEIRRNIPAGAVLVDFARFGIFDFAAKGQARKWQPARYAAWVIPPAGKGDVTILDLGPAEAIDALVATYRKGIDAVSGKNGFARGHFTLENEMRKTARPATQALLEPILAALAKAGLAPSEIILSPDGALWLLPWQALPLGDGEDAPYAIEKFAFRTVTSGRDLVPPPDDARPKTKSTRGPVVVADPAFDATPPAAAGARAVPDLESAQIMAGFYDNVARGSPPSQALREAQLAFIKQRRADRNYESAHPFHWAAYGVTGR